MLDGNPRIAASARSALAGTTPVITVSATGNRRGVVVEEVAPVHVLQVITRRGKAGAVVVALRDATGVDAPQTPTRIAKGDVALVWSGPGQWLVMSPGASETSKRVTAALAGLAAVVDQSDARVHLRLTGPDVRAALAKLVMLDLHPGEFAPGAAAMTVIAHVPVHLWRLTDGVEGPVFVIAGPQSYATSLWHHIVISAAEYGLDARVLG